MSPTEKIELMRLIQFTKDKYQISVLLVDHDMQVVMGHLPAHRCARLRD